MFFQSRVQNNILIDLGETNSLSNLDRVESLVVNSMAAFRILPENLVYAIAQLNTLLRTSQIIITQEEVFDPYTYADGTGLFGLEPGLQLIPRAYLAWLLVGNFDRTFIVVTSNIVATTPISVIASGVGFTKTGDNGDLHASALLFNTNDFVKIYRNGTLQRNGTDVTWVSQSSFAFAEDLYIGEEIQVFS